MSCKRHEEHAHEHGEGCGHTAVEHDGHTDYLHDGHLHHVHGDHVDEHSIAVDSKPTPRAHAHPNHKPAASTRPTTMHGPGCGHEAVPHGDHVDYLVDGHLHHPHAGHCDDHGPLTLV